MTSITPSATTANRTTAQQLIMVLLGTCLLLGITMLWFFIKLSDAQFALEDYQRNAQTAKRLAVDIKRWKESPSATVGAISIENDLTAMVVMKHASKVGIADSSIRRVSPQGTELAEGEDAVLSRILLELQGVSLRSLSELAQRLETNYPDLEVTSVDVRSTSRSPRAIPSSNKKVSETWRAELILTQRRFVGTSRS